MKSKKTSLLFLSSLALLLAACGQSNPAQDSSSQEQTTSSTQQSTSSEESTASSESTDTSGSTSSEISSMSTVTGKGIDFLLFGDFYVGQSRAIYVEYDEGVTHDEVVFESSDSTIARVTNMAELDETNSYIDMPEALVAIDKEGTFGIRAYLKNNPSVEVVRFYQVRSGGDTLPQGTFDSLTSTMKVVSQVEQLSFNKDYEPSVDNSLTLTTIYEENGEASTDYRTGARTDAYLLEELNNKTGSLKTYSYVRTNSNKVGSEYLDHKNRVCYQNYTDESGDTYRWESSYYYNFFADESVVTASDFVSYDGGKTYRFMGDFLQATYLCASLYLTDMSPDDFFLSIDGTGTIQFTINIDPVYARSSATPYKKYGQKIVSTVSEIGTATYPHVQPYEAKEYTSKVSSALAKMASCQNYKAELAYDYVKSLNNDIYQTITFTPDCADSIVTTGGKTNHSGAKKVSESEYYLYTVDGDTPTKGETKHSYWHNPSAGVSRYPTFDIAGEIFTQVDENTYKTQGTLGYAIIYMSYLPTIAGRQFTDYEEETTITINEDGYITSATTTAYEETERVNITLTFSEFETAVPNVDFSKLVIDDTPTSWEEDRNADSLVRSLNEWRIEGVQAPAVLPYAYSTAGWGLTYGWLRTDPTFFHFSTGKFLDANNEINTARMDEFIADYIAAMVEAGYQATTQTDPRNADATIYKNAQGYMMSVAYEKNWSGTINTGEVKIAFHVDDASKLVLEETY